MANPDMEDIEPLKSEPNDFAPVTDESAPYGLKKDGTPAKRRGRPAGYKLGPRTGLYTKGSLEQQLRAFFILISAPLRLIPALQKDALDEIEIDALAKSIDQQCQTSPAFRKYVEQMLKVNTSIGVVGVVGIIAARRLIRHDIIPVPEEIGGNEAADAMLGMTLATMVNKGPINPGIVVPEAA